MHYRSPLALLALLLPLFLSAQDNLFTVRVGSFQDVGAADFAELDELGFIYGAPRENRVTDVYLGNFSTSDQATSIATDLVGRGYRNAQALALPIASGTPVTVIQLGLYSTTRKPAWAELERAGPLYVEAVDGVEKVTTGVFPDFQTAADYLPQVRALGYTDAFVKRLNNVRLIPVGTFETGIKKPLIPLDLGQVAPASTAPQQASSGVVVPPGVGTSSPPAPAPTTQSPPAAQEPQVQPQPNAPNQYARAGGALTTAPPAAATPPTLPAPADVPGLPQIDGSRKLHSSAELQRVLKEKGYYEGSIDGLYGPGTRRAYLSAWDDLPEVRKYRLLSGGLFASVDPSREAVTNWPEVSVLLAIVEDMAAAQGNSDTGRQLAQQRSQLFNASQGLSPAAASRVRNWAATVWTTMNQWAEEDPLHAQMLSALRVAYYQTHARLENMYMDRGVDKVAARDLATAMMQNLTGAQLDQFL